MVWSGVGDRRDIQSGKAGLGLFLVILPRMEPADEPAEHQSRTEMTWNWEAGIPSALKGPRPQEKGRSLRARVLTQNSGETLDQNTIAGS